VSEKKQRHIYDQEGKHVEVFADGSNLAPSPAYVRSWLDLLGRTPRVAPFLGKNALSLQLRRRYAIVTIPHLADVLEP
jgi:hypothetical protein